jgi:hypothetical protein
MAHTNVGDIDLCSVSGPIAVSANAGSILGLDLSSSHATLRLSAGDVDVTFLSAPGSVTATAAVGSVTLRLPRRRVLRRTRDCHCRHHPRQRRPRPGVDARHHRRNQDRLHHDPVNMLTGSHGAALRRS